MEWDFVGKQVGANWTTGSTTAVDIPNLSYPALASSLYDVECYLLGQSTGTLGVNFATSFSVAGSTGTFLVFSSTTTSAISTDCNVIGSLVDTAFWTTAATNLSALIKAMVKTGVDAGNITIQAAKVTSGTVTINAGSVIKIRKIG